MAGFSFSKIHILESLPTGELHTGRVLRTAVLLAHPEAAARVQLREIADRQDLHAALVAIAAEAEQSGSIPFIHFECHGSRDGLELSSGELVGWDTFREWFIPLNLASQMNLFVSLAACHGDWLASAIRMNEPAPVWGLLGPRAAENVGALSDSFRTFFVTLLTTSDLRSALSAVGGGLPHEGKPFVLWPAEYFFAFAFHSYVREYCSPSEIARRAKRLAARVQQENGWSVDTRRDLARKLRHDLRNLEPYFTRFLAVYLMLDRFPQNCDRFGLTWAELQKIDPRQSRKDA